ncbi:glycosyltransferase family 2 protein [Succinimonas sp.]|jgi:glycosyltransferase involved in cell wall biosynthesis|uniref:glycosyltransferase family 2 protein n=1 Tax=Succinimonas sp. TaxID=1936151 RepID=UPI00387000BC
MEPITGVIITLNEERHIEACIESLKQVCSSIIVVDSCSGDRTRELAEKAGAKVVIQKYLGDGPQKNVGPDLAETPWVLSLDADERLSPEMAAEIKALNLSESPVPAYGFPRKNYIGSRWIRHSGWYPDVCVRLYDHTKVRWKDVRMHSYVEARDFRRLNGSIIHYSYRGIGELFRKADSYSNAIAKNLYQRGKRAGALSPFSHGLTAFFKHYVVKGGFLDGVDGMTVSISAAVNSYLKYAKLLEFQRDPEILKNEDFSEVW